MRSALLGLLVLLGWPSPCPWRAADPVILVVPVDPAPLPLPLPAPEPVAPPTPVVPPPAPVPGDVLWVSYIVPVPTTPDQAAVRTDPELRRALAAIGARYHTYQAGQADLHRLGMAAYAATAPCVLVQDRAGHLLAHLPAPTAAAVLAAAKAARSRP